MNRIWERYLFTEALKTFFLFLGCFYFLYAMIDYSTHMQDFFIDTKIQFSHVAQYYGLMFIKRADLLIPLALLISIIKLLFSLNRHGELIALQASGISLKKIARPLMLLASLCILFNYLSFQFFLPSSLNFLDRFRENHFKHAHRGERTEPVYPIYLEDGSKIIYQKKIDREGQPPLLFDAFWISSPDALWRIKYLDLEQSTGRYVDHIERNAEGNFEKTASLEEHSFPPFKWQPNLAGKGYIPTENKALSELYRLYFKEGTSPVEMPQILTHLLFKCLMPLLPLFLLLIIFPYCVRHKRTSTPFPIYALSLFGFIAFGALIDACVILGESQFASPFFILLAPFALLLAWSLLSFKKIASH